MVNTAIVSSSPLTGVRRIVNSYLALVVATVVALVALSVLAPRYATSEAWGHALIVAFFAVLLRLRVHAAEKGSGRAVRAVAIIGIVVGLVNVVETALPGVFPLWMRISMVVVVGLMVALVVALRRSRSGGAALDTLRR